MCHSDAENGKKASKIQSEYSNNVPPGKQQLTMDEALSKTKFGLFNYVLILVGGIALYALACETSVFAYVMPVACDLNLTSAQKGILAGAVYCGIICSSHLWGYLADTKGRRCIIQITLLMAFFSTVICSFVQNVYIFIVLRFLTGFFIAGSFANMFAYIGEFHNDKHRTHAIIAVTVIYNGLCALIAVAAYLVINQNWRFQVPLIDLTYKPWRLFLVIGGLPSFLSAFGMQFLPESPKFVLSQGNKTEAYRILQKVNRWNNGSGTEFEEFEILDEEDPNENKELSSKTGLPLSQSVWNQTAPLFKPPYLRSTILLCAMQFGIYAVFNGYFMFIGEIINKMSNNLDSFVHDRIKMCDAINMNSVNASTRVHSEACIDKLNVSVMQNGVVFEVVLTAGLGLAGLLLKVVGKFPVILFILWTSALSGIGCMFTKIPLLQIFLYIWLMCAGIINNILGSATVDLYPTTLRAMAVSISLMFGRLGGIAGINTVALLMDNSCEITFYLAGSLLIVMGILAFFIPNIHKK